MSKLMLICVCICFTVTVNAQSINLHGTISDQAGEPISGAVVTLVGQQLQDTSESDGTYSILKEITPTMPLRIPHNTDVFMHNGGLFFSLVKSSNVKIRIFDVNGSLLKKMSMQNVTTGFYNLNLETNSQATKLFILKVSMDQTERTFRYFTLPDGRFSANSADKKQGIQTSAPLAKINAIDDTLKVSAEGFSPKVIAIDSYEKKIDIVLDTATTGSIGCGKELTNLKSGTYKISSAGLEREYIIDIPQNYDKNKPYRVVFGMHCMGSSAQGVVSEQYYGLKPLANKDNIPCIFVAPQGYTDNSPWRVSDNKDHVFFSDMLKLFKEELCVDTARVFCCGFSYGAMVSYSLSTAFQKQLRAVACYAPANWNIWLPENTHEPIAYYQTTGTGDNLCSWVNSDARKQGGKYCVLQHIEDNGCTIPGNIPTATGGNHVSTEFEGCQENYPVKFSSFNGGHQGTATDPGSNENWIAKETWEFFMRF